MESTAKLFQFPSHISSAPNCAQCHTKMTIQRVEPTAKEGMETHVYGCADCGLIDRLVKRCE